MRLILEIKSIVTHSSRYIGKDPNGKEFVIDTDRPLQIGESVLLINGVVVGKVQTTSPKIYEV